MPGKETLTQAITPVLDLMAPVGKSLSSRADFNSKLAPFDIRQMIEDFEAYSQQLTTCSVADPASKAQLDRLLAMARDTIAPAITTVMLANAANNKMNIANPRKTISNVSASQQDDLFGDLQKKNQVLIAVVEAEEAPPVPVATLAIRSIRVTSRQVAPGTANKLLQRNGAGAYLRADGTAIATTLDQTAGAFNNLEWDVARGGAGEPFSQTQNSQITLELVCRVTATHGPVTVNGFYGQLDGAPAVLAGAVMGPAAFTQALQLNGAAVPAVGAVVNPGAPVDFTFTLEGVAGAVGAGGALAANLPQEVGISDLGVTAFANTTAGVAQDTVAAASRVYLTFGQPTGAVQSPAANTFARGGAVQDITPARLELAITALRTGMAPIAAGGGIRGTWGVPGFTYATAVDCADAIFLFFKSRGIEFTLGYNWLPAANTTGLAPKPGNLDTYFWMAMSPTPGIAAPLNHPQTEAWAECHNLAVALILVAESLGIAPFDVDYGLGAGPELGYALNYPQARRTDVFPYPAQVAPEHGLLRTAYQRAVAGPNGTVGNQSLCFTDQFNGGNNFEGVTVFNNQRLYPLGECILAEANRAHNANNYYCFYPGVPDYIDQTILPAVPAGFNAAEGLQEPCRLYFFGNYVDWFWTPFGVNWGWQNGRDPDPYPGAVVAATTALTAPVMGSNPVVGGAIPQYFRWEN
ncbi:hypothetical protein ACTL6U_09345 [Rhodovibrionaceae bacterium A322]